MIRRRNALSKYLDKLLSEGRIVFTATEAETALGISHRSFLESAERLQRSRKLLNPRQGFYVVVPPQHAALGSPPPAWFIDSLMKWENTTYYVGLLKAAELHGASHQAVMQFQVMCGKRLPEIRAGRNRIVFHFRRAIPSLLSGLEDHKTDTGTMRVSSAALTALDLLRYPHASGGIDTVATVLSELSHAIDPNELSALCNGVEKSVVQRLGYLLAWLGEDSLANRLSELLLSSGSLHWTELERDSFDADFSSDRAVHDTKWRVVSNRHVELDL